MDSLGKNPMETWQALAQEVIRLNESANDMMRGGASSLLKNLWSKLKGIFH